MSTACQVVIGAIEKEAPKYLAEEWDNVGMLVGDPGREVSKVMLTLDCTTAVVDEAIRKQVDLIVGHHPLIFAPIKQIRADLPGQALVAKLLRHDIAFYAAHTNLDSAPIGGAKVLADFLELTEQDFLLPGYQDQIFKLTVFVPESHLEQVRSAISKAGGGVMGGYSECFFQLEGKGTFRPSPGSKPFIGSVGNLEKVEETRLETIVPSRNLDKTVKAMLKAHPYEVPAYDIILTKNPCEAFGIGRVGNLPQEKTLAELTQMVKKMLGNCPLRVAGDMNKKIKKTAVSTGSGGSLVKKAAAKGAGVLIAGDISHHDALDALEAGVAIIDPGHYATEWFMVENLTKFLQQKMHEDKRDVEIILSEVKTEPFSFV